MNVKHEARRFSGFDSRPVGRQNIAVCAPGVWVIWIYLYLYISVQPVFVFAKLYMFVGIYRFKFQNISAYLAFAICRDLLTFDVLINWKGKLIFIIWLIDPPEIVDCNRKLQSRVHIYWIAELTCYSTPPLTAAWAFNCIQVGAWRFTDVVPGVETPHATRHTLHAPRQLVQNLCNWRRALIAVTLQQWSRSSSVLWPSKRSRMRFQLSYGTSESIALWAATPLYALLYLLTTIGNRSHKLSHCTREECYYVKRVQGTRMCI